MSIIKGTRRGFFQGLVLGGSGGLTSLSRARREPERDPDDWALRPNLFVAYKEIKSRSEWGEEEKRYLLDGQSCGGIGFVQTLNTHVGDHVRCVRSWAQRVRDKWFEPNGIDPLDIFTLEILIRGPVSERTSTPGFQYETVHMIYPYLDPSRVPPVPESAGVACPRASTWDDEPSSRPVEFRAELKAAIINKAFSFCRASYDKNTLRTTGLA